jgi:small subunit ribosomal protein S2
MSISLQQYMTAGVHFGHKTRLWNPKMKPYIYMEKDGIHIINIYRTAQNLEQALTFIKSQVSDGKSVLFVGTKRSASSIISEQAVRCGQFYVNNRWLGGTLTNYKTIKASIDKLIRMEKEMESGALERRTKKERLDHERKVNKMVRSLGGIKKMKKQPGVLFVIDPKREHIAIKEANILGIPVVALCDTNCDPQGIKYVIPGNDDAIKSIELFASAIADAVEEGKSHGRRSASKKNSATVDVETYTKGNKPLSDESSDSQKN